MKYVSIIILSLSFVVPTFGNYKAPQFDLHELKFSNRARCAVESGKPSKSAFLLISNVDAAKAVYRFAKFRGENVEDATKRGINRFRFSVLSLMNLIHERLTSRQLPILPADITRDDQHVPSSYRKVMKGCRQGEYCAELDDYLSSLWNIASNESLSAGSKYLEFFKVDNYHSKENYLTEKDYEKKSTRQMSCAYLKKFSPLQAHLYGTKPNKGAIEAIADAVATANTKFAKCDDFESQENLQVAAYELHLPNLREKSLFRKESWINKGFDYWHSMRLYLSFAFRNAPELEQMAFPYGNLFRGVILEESVMIVPNGCRSLSPPKCDGDRLALNSIREFAKEDFKKNALELDILSETPNGPDDDLVEDMIPSVNVDELDLAAHRTAGDWLEAFSGNLSSSRALMKKRLIKAINHFNFVTKAVPVKTLLSKLDQHFGGKLFSGKAIELSEDKKNELYYLCSEFSFSQHENWSFIRGNLEILEKSSIVDGLTKQISQVSTNESFSYFMTLGDAINKACYDLKQHEIWDEDFNLDKEGFLPWYTAKIYENKVKSKHDEKIAYYLENNQPLLSFPTYSATKSEGDVICAHASDCARKTVEATLALYSATQYASTFWSLEQKVKSPDLFNPYSERTACKVYDPWYKTRSTIFSFLWDMGQTAASAFVPGMIYTKAELKPRMVTSFKQLIKDGKLEYDTQYSKQKILLAITADFGPLTGVPCAVSLNRTANNPMSAMRFTGISVGACNSEQDYNLNVNNASDIGANGGRGHSECLSCSINFESVSGVLAYATQNVGPAFFLVRGIYNLYKALKDPFNIPRSWEVHPYDAYETKAYYGYLPKKCVRSLRKGKRCLDPCAEKISETLREKMIGHVKDWKISTNGNWGSVAHSHCSERIRIQSSESSFDNNRGGTCRIKKMIIPASCKEFMK